MALKKKSNNSCFVCLDAALHIASEIIEVNILLSVAVWNWMLNAASSPSIFWESCLDRHSHRIHSHTPQIIQWRKMERVSCIEFQ